MVKVNPAIAPDGLCGQPPKVERCEECMSIGECKIGIDFLGDVLDLGDATFDDEEIVRWWGL